ncbi:MAG: Electron transport protein HydN [Planctomycetota bacterium]|jgi:Fe-S-cluster-containing dehydrogenase component/CRP-like cAMP-binding protein
MLVILGQEAEVLETIVAVRRPKRWDIPLDPTMSDSDVEWLLAQPPLCELDSARFPKSTPLADIIRNDCRLVRYEHGDLIVREGDYGGSAYLVLQGKVRVFVTRLDESLLGRRETTKQSWWKSLISTMTTRGIAEVRQSPPVGSSSPVAVRRPDGQTHVFLQDIDRLFATHQTNQLGKGEIFGELSAINRSPRPFSVVADGPVALLEIRWQGLRLLRRDPTFREQVENLYRRTSLLSHLREVTLFRFLPEDVLTEVAAQIRFQSFGELEWYSEFEETQRLDVQQRIGKESLIAEEGSSADHLIMIRSGFARLSERQGAGHRTVAYLGRGQQFGLDEMVHNWKASEGRAFLPYQHSLRAIGYVDVLRLSWKVLHEKVFPHVRRDELANNIQQPRYEPGRPVLDMPVFGLSGQSEDEPIDTSVVEFLVDERLINGKQTMIIDTLRCTRCDDCVRACASFHDGNPRFVRQGPQHGQWLFPHACMHCSDPVCMIGCPTGAIARDTIHGIVSINPDTCIGCKTCAESCPYDNIKMVEIRNKSGQKLVDHVNQLPILQATKCDLCYGHAGGPACQKACPQDALIRIDMADIPNLQKWLKRHAA